MKLISSRILAVAGVLALGAVATAAEARVNVGLGINLGGPVYAAPAPVYAPPMPAYVAPPAPVAYGYGYAAPQAVVVAPPAPVYIAPPPAVSIYYGPSYGYAWHRGHYRHWR